MNESLAYILHTSALVYDERIRELNSGSLSVPAHTQRNGTILVMTHLNASDWPLHS